MIVSIHVGVVKVGVFLTEPILFGELQGDDREAL